MSKSFTLVNGLQKACFLVQRAGWQWIKSRWAPLSGLQEKNEWTPRNAQSGHKTSFSHIALVNSLIFLILSSDQQCSLPDTLPVPSLHAAAVAQGTGVPGMWHWATPRTRAAPEHTHGAGHTRSRDRDGAVAPVCHHHPGISLTCPSSATTAQGGSAASVAMPGMFWQEVFPESCTFEKALKKPRPLCLNADWRQTHKLSILFISYCLI